MFDLVPVDHDPFADPPFKLIPVDHDPFAVGPVAQPADPAMAGAGTAAPQLVPVDHDPFAAAPTGALPHIIVHPKSPNAPPDNPAGADGIDDWFVPTADGYPDDWFVPAPACNARTIRARRTVQRRRSACLQSARGAAGSLCGLLVAHPGEPCRRAGLGSADLSRRFDELFARRISPIRLACRAARRKPERSDLRWPFRRFGSAGAGESISWIRAPVWRPAEPSGRAGAVEPRHRERVPDGATAIRGRTTCLADRAPTDHGLFDRRDRRRRRQIVRGRRGAIRDPVGRVPR